ncbi:hypothetical protein [Rothia endophytica]|uniref:hypothetical protein n=1 Tax=Rothia endophytica TaxID=1324766 RepID=UPI001F4471B6|nr:hypothetical protein [Rothia endophytica]
MKLKILATVGILVALATSIYSLWGFFNPGETNKYVTLILLALMMGFLIPTQMLSNRQRQQKSMTDSRDSTA